MRALAGAFACMLLARALGADRMLDVGVRAMFDLGWVGFLVPALALAIAGLGRPERSAFRAGISLGLLAPTAAVVAACGLWQGALLLTVAYGLLAVLLTWGAWRGVRGSDEPAALRLAITTAGVTALLVGAVATVCIMPNHDGMHAWPQPRILPAPHVVVAVIALRWTLRRLAERRVIALLGIALAGVCIGLAPHLGYPGGCMSVEGPLEWLLAPRWIAPALLGLWAGPIVRFLRQPSDEPDERSLGPTA